MTTRTPPNRRSYLAQGMGLLGWLAVAFAAAAVGAVASIEASAFYAQLTQPAWAPPASVFGPVWSALYTLMGIAAWLVWREQGARNLKPALALFVIQLAVNALWSWLFFAWHKGGYAFAEMLVLVALIVITIGLFWRIRRLAAILMMPYLAWVCFASVLTWAVWQANPGLL